MAFHTSLDHLELYKYMHIRTMSILLEINMYIAHLLNQFLNPFLEIASQFSLGSPSLPAHSSPCFLFRYNTKHCGVQGFQTYSASFLVVFFPINL